MTLLWALSMARANHVVELLLPFPVRPLFGGEQRVCVDVPLEGELSSTEVEDGGFRVSCGSDRGSAHACISILEGTPWPRRVPEYVCAGEGVRLVVQAVPAFDPLDDITDGVEILRGVDSFTAAFRVPHLPDAAGILAGGRCGVSDGLLWMELRLESARAPSCTLVLGDSELVVPIHLVGRLAGRTGAG